MIMMSPVQRIGRKETSQLYYRERSKPFDLNKKPFHLSMQLDACFFERKYMDNLEFREGGLDFSELFLLKAYDYFRRYAILKDKCKIEEYLSGDFYNYPLLYDKNWYIPTLRDDYLPFLKEHSNSRIVQAGILQMLEFRLAGNVNEGDTIKIDVNNGVLTASA